MSSSRYDADDPKQRLQDIADRLGYIHAFIGGHTLETFNDDRKTVYAVVRALEELCESAYWFVKNANGEQIRKRHSNVDFNIFGVAGNVYRHQYWNILAARVWSDIHEGADIGNLETMLEMELPFYRRLFPR